MAEGAEQETRKAIEKTKVSVRAFVEHPFHLLKNLFRHHKVRYRGLANERASTLHALWTRQCDDRRTNRHDMKKP